MTLRNYYRVTLGQGNTHAAEAFAGDFIGADFGIAVDLTNDLPDDWRAFNKKFIPVYLADHPEKSRVAAGLVCGALWSVAKGINEGDIVLSPDGFGDFRAGEVTGGYHYAEGDVLPHRRPMHWYADTIRRADMSDGLQKSILFGPTQVRAYPEFAQEIEALIDGVKPPLPIVSTDEMIEDPVAFAMEQHLEEFLVANWSHTGLAKDYDIYSEDGQPVGRQYPTDTGPLDILAVSKDGKTLLVIELKKGKASDVVVGQTLRYMGYVQEVLAEPGQSVRGAIIALDDDQRIQRALAVTPSVTFFRYKVHFELVPA